MHVQLLRFNANFDKLEQNDEIYNSELTNNTALASLYNEFVNLISSTKLFDINFIVLKKSIFLSKYN